MLTLKSVFSSFFVRHSILAVLLLFVFDYSPSGIKETRQLCVLIAGLGISCSLFLLTLLYTCSDQINHIIRNTSSQKELKKWVQADSFSEGNFSSKAVSRYAPIIIGAIFSNIIYIIYILLLSYNLIISPFPSFANHTIDSVFRICFWFVFSFNIVPIYEVLHLLFGLCKKGSNSKIFQSYSKKSKPTSP